jgi:hypothetical protein
MGATNVEHIRHGETRRTATKMIRASAFLLLGIALAFAQDHHQMVKEHGDK